MELFGKIATGVFYTGLGLFGVHMTVKAVDILDKDLNDLRNNHRARKAANAAKA